ncbi:Cytochrome c-type biogenesis protein CcmH [Burkholderiaceae bacterium]|nr:Cytochrome c-type biogenesis protein CcmH [Burkholderiaceae bacterium]
MKLVITLLLALFTLGAHAQQAVPMAEDEAVEKRLIAIADELRCLVCQNESLAASRSDLAQDLRREVRTLIKAGKSDAEIREFLVARYGDFVLYRPPLKPTTWLLWASPFVLMALGLIGLSWHLRRRRHDDAVLTDADKARAAALLSGDR